MRVTAARTPSGVALGGLSADTCGPGEILVLLADPFSLPIDDVVAMLGQLDPPVVVVGGAASAPAAPAATGWCSTTRWRATAPSGSSCPRR